MKLVPTRSLICPFFDFSIAPLGNRNLLIFHGSYPPRFDVTIFKEETILFRRTISTSNLASFAQMISGQGSQKFYIAMFHRFWPTYT